MANKRHKQVITLRNGEGEISIYVSLKEDSNEELLEGTRLESLESDMIHRPLCGGIVHFIHISREKDVLHCSICGLRIDVPEHINTIGELVVYLMVHG